MALPIENRDYSFADYLTWKGDDRIELMNGEAVMMAPPTRYHQGISGELHRQLANYLEGKGCKVYAAPFAVRLFQTSEDKPEDVRTVVEPDISIICDQSKLDDFGCKGAPDFIAEILSPSTLRHDRVTKFNLYQEAGVQEYWIINPEDKSVQVFVLEKGRYKAVDILLASGLLKVNVLDDCAIDIEKLFQP